MAAPQKKFLGKVISEDESNCLAGELAEGAEFAVPAFDETLQAENSPAGRAVATPASRAECVNWRRVRRKTRVKLLKNDTRWTPVALGRYTGRILLACIVATGRHSNRNRRHAHGGRESGGMRLVRQADCGSRCGRGSGGRPFSVCQRERPACVYKVIAGVVGSDDSASVARVWPAFHPTSSAG